MCTSDDARREASQFDLFLDPKGSLSATMVVLLVVVTRFRKMPKAVNTQWKVAKLRVHIRDIIPDRSTVLDF